MKKKSKMLDKKTIKIFVYALLVLGIIEFTIYPETNSKYLDQPENAAFSYQANLYGLYKGVIEKVPSDSKKLEKIVLVPAQSTYKKMTLNLFFTRNENIMNDVSSYKDTFSLELPTNCSIKDGHGYDKNENKITDTNIIAINNKKNTIRVNDNKEAVVNKIFVSMTCDLTKMMKDKSTDYTVSFPIREHVNNEEEDFIIWDVEYSIKKENYHKLSGLEIPTVKIDLDKRQLIIPKNYEEDKLTVFQNFIKKYVDKYETDTKELVKKDTELIVKYATDAYKDFIITNGGTTKKKDINGMKAICDDKNCTYTIQDNFIGYAKTEMTKNNASNIVYFSDVASLGKNDSTKLNEILKYYLYQYIYKDEELTPDKKNEKADKVYDYILNSCEQDIRKLFKEDFILPHGVLFDKSEQSLKISDKILDLIEVVDKEIIIVDRHLKEDNTVDVAYMQEELFSQFKKIYPKEKLHILTDTRLGQFFVEYIGNNEEIVNVFLKRDNTVEELSKVIKIIDSKYSDQTRYYDVTVEANNEYSTIVIVETDALGNAITTPVDEENNTPVTPSDNNTSSGGPDEGNDTAIKDTQNKIEDLEVPETSLDGVTNLTVNEEENGLKVTIDAKNSENIVSIVESLDEHFAIAEPTTIPASTFIPKEDGTYEAVYTIKTK